MARIQCSRRGPSRRFLVLAAFGALALGAATPASAQQTIKLGFIGPLSGGNAQQGLGARNGFLLAIEQANKGGYPFKVEPVVLDDASDPQTGVSAALKLVNDRDVVAATGHWNSPVALATTPVFSRSGMPFIVWGAISPRITEQNFPEVTRVTPTLLQENKPLAELMAKQMGVKTVGLISDTSDYGVNNTKSFTEFFTAAGGKVVSTDAAPVGTTDFRAILTRVKGANPDAVYFGGVITEAALVRRQMIELGLNVPMFGISGIYDPKLIEIAGEAANGTVVGVPKVQANPKLDAFEKAYKERNFPEPPGSYAKFAYDAAGILLQAIREAGPTDKRKIAQTIRGISYDGVLGKTTFDANGQTQIPVEINVFTVRDGKWQPHQGS